MSDLFSPFGRPAGSFGIANIELSWPDNGTDVRQPFRAPSGESGCGSYRVDQAGRHFDKTFRCINDPVLFVNTRKVVERGGQCRHWRRFCPNVLKRVFDILVQAFMRVQLLARFSELGQHAGNIDRPAALGAFCRAPVLNIA